MITIDYLKNHQETIPTLAKIWHEVLGKIWLPKVSIKTVEQNLQNSLNDNAKQHDLPITLVALNNNIPVGMCSLIINDGIRPDLTPWLGSLVVDSNYHSKGIGEMLVNNIKIEAKKLKFKKLYLFAFDPTIYKYYQKFGFNVIDIDKFKDHKVLVMKANLQT